MFLYFKNIFHPIILHLVEINVEVLILIFGHHLFHEKCHIFTLG